MLEDVLARFQSSIADRYRVTRELDRGGTAVVYLAEDLRHHRNVAVKVLLPALATTLGAERFLREVEVVARLQHPHILPLIDSGETEGLPWYVTPFVEGQSLSSRLKREGPLSVEAAVQIAVEVADALAYAHGAGVIHRDVKPANILLSDGHAVVADFGIAAAIEHAATRLTQTGASLGSPLYMSPEQAIGAPDLDRRTDVYSLGCVVYELLTGRSPFEGESLRAIVSRKALGEFRPASALRPEVPADVDAAIAKALAPYPGDRFADVRAFRSALEAALRRLAADTGVPARGRRGRAVASAATVALAVVATMVFAMQRARTETERALWAREQLAEIERLAEQGRFRDALDLALEVQPVLRDTAALALLWPLFSFTVPIRTDPAGARVYRRELDAPEEQWEFVGLTPLETVRFAGRGDFRGDELLWRFERPGHRPVELLSSAVSGRSNLPRLDPVRLDPDSVLPEEMVRVPGFAEGGVAYGDYFMDRHEVTNRRYQEFVDAGGYVRPEYWTEPFLTDGAVVSWEEAVAGFVDQTGRPGPSTWQLGTYPEGTGDYPVGGVSWFEAAAYARFAGKELPTTTHWAQADRFYRETSWASTPRSNLGGAGPRPVGQGRAMGTLGIYDWLGNLREWCYNEVGAERATRGGGWTDPPFMAGGVIPRSPWNRDPTNGIRLVRTFDGDALLASLRSPVTPTRERDYRSEKTATPAEVRIYRRLYAYDPLPLDPRVEAADTAEHWIRERVTFELPYGERGAAYLYVPRHRPPPYQAVLYWPTSGHLSSTSIEQEYIFGFDFLVRTGRVVALPVFKYGLERDNPTTRTHNTILANVEGTTYRETQVHWVQDLSRTIDYLETREDIDAGALGFYGFSWGGSVANIALAVEERIKAAVLNVGGFSLRAARPLPEADPFHFAPEVRQPVLMLNGQYDIVFPLETSQKPMFELLGTPPEHKRHHVTLASHLVPADELMRETLAWLDRYLGRPASGATRR